MEFNYCRNSIDRLGGQNQLSMEIINYLHALRAVTTFTKITYSPNQSLTFAVVEISNGAQPRTQAHF